MQSNKWLTGRLTFAHNTMFVHLKI